MIEYWPFQKFIKTKLQISQEEKEQIKIMLYNFKNTTDPDQITTYQIIDFLNLPILKKIKEQIENILNPLSLSIINSWGQLYRQSHFHEPHIHPASIYSGVIYVDGQGQDGTIFLDTYSGATYCEKFEKDTLILFPSRIVHFVKSQKEDNGRIVISFNTERKKC